MIYIFLLRPKLTRKVARQKRPLQFLLKGWNQKIITRMSKLKVNPFIQKKKTLNLIGISVHFSISLGKLNKNLKTIKSRKNMKKKLLRKILKTISEFCFSRNSELILKFLLFFVITAFYLSN